jgi:hypothetical protein
MRVLNHAWLRIVVFIALGGSTSWFVGQRLIEGTSSFRGVTFEEDGSVIAVVVAMFAASTLMLGAAWLVLIEDIASRRGPRLQLMLAFVYAWLVRYVPGTVPFFAGKVYLGRRAGYPTKHIALATGLQNMLEVLVSAVVGSVCVALALGVTLGGGAYAALALVPGVGLVALHPSILGRVTNGALRALGREPLPAGALPSTRAIALAAALTAANQCMNGVAMLLIMTAVTGAGVEDMLLATGALSLAGVAGILVVFLPAGLGVRDGALTGLLATRFAVEAAAVAAILARLIAVVADIALVAIALLVDILAGAGVVSSALRRAATSPPVKRRVAADAMPTERRSA